MKIFISHSSKDKLFSKRLAADLGKAGHAVFLDEWIIKAGHCIPTAISEALAQADCLIIVLTSHSVISRWVDEEWKTAYWEEISGNKIRVIPILLDDCDIPILLRKRRYANFRDGYDNGFEELIEGIEVTEDSGLFVGVDTANSIRSIDEITEERPQLSPTAAQLADCMSDISENCWHARWNEGLEYDLWHAVLDGQKRFGDGTITNEQIALLKALSKACGGWVAFGEEELAWIPIDYWKWHYEDPRQHPIQGQFWSPRDEVRRRLLYGFIHITSQVSFKREALFFDRIVVPGLTGILERRYDGDISQERNMIRLVEDGVVVPSGTTSTFYIKGEAERVLVSKMQGLSWSSLEWEALYARLTSLQFARKHGVEAYPIYHSLRSFGAGVNRERERVLRVIFSQIPTPHKSVSWSQILEYRQDPDSHRRFAALRVWINRMASRKVSEEEAFEELEYLLAEFESHFRHHKLCYELMPLEAVVSTEKERVEELTHKSNARRKKTKMRVKGIPRGIFPDAEFLAPGKEIAYISFTKERFSHTD
jgi:hypothetical protein